MKNIYVGKEIMIREKLLCKVGANIQAQVVKVMILKIGENIKQVELSSSVTGSANHYNYFAR